MRLHALVVSVSLGLLFLLHAPSVGSTPGKLRRWYHPSPIVNDSEEQGECLQIDHECNVVFNRSAKEKYAKFPNARGTTMAASSQEFNDFFPLLIKNCSLKLWTLLCFHYFPQCCPDLPLRYSVTPCRETCQEVKERCFGIMQYYNISWPEHMECTKFNTAATDPLCINDAPDPKYVERVTSPTMPPEISPSSSTNPTSPTSPTTPTIPPTTTRSTEASESSSGSTASDSTPTSNTLLPCKKCHYRKRANAGTFKRNRFAFAANITVIASHQTSDGYHAYLAEVKRMWVIDAGNCSSRAGYVLLRTTYTHCPPCPNLNLFSTTNPRGNIYLVSGYCNDRGWSLPPNDCLATNWFSNPKYQSKISDWVQSGIASRQN